MASSSPAPAAPAATQGPLKNLYHRRQVADTAARPCFICHKPTSTVLATPDARDFFYACAGHLADRGFASPVVPANASPPADNSKNKDDAELQRQIDAVKAEYEAKQARRTAKKTDKPDDADATKDKDKDKDKDKADSSTKERDDKLAELEKKKTDKKTPPQEPATPAADEKTAASTSRIFTLHRGIFAMRTAKLAAAQTARRTADRVRTPTAFPSVPTKPF